MGWSWDDDPPAGEAQRLENERQVYDRIEQVVAEASANPTSFRITPAFICELHALATAGEVDPRKAPGRFRTDDVQIGRVAQRVPPPWQEVRALVDVHCDAINRALNRESPLHVSAYAVWVINWIHPFGDGNGRTARAIMYAILCVGFGRMLPEDPTILRLIARDPYSYVDALVAAHRAWNDGRGVVDISAVESWLFGLVARVLPEASDAGQSGD